MISKNKNLFLKIYIPFVILTIIALIVLQILGSKKRVGYLTDFNLNIERMLNLYDLENFIIGDKSDEEKLSNYLLTNENITNYIYHFRIRYYDKTFRNNDIYGVYVDLSNLPDYMENAEMEENGSPYGNFISDKKDIEEKIDNINYTLRIKKSTIISLISLLFIIIFIYLLMKYINKYYYNDRNQLIALPIFLVLLMLINRYYMFNSSSYVRFNSYIIIFIFFIITLYLIYIVQYKSKFFSNVFSDVYNIFIKDRVYMICLFVSFLIVYGFELSHFTFDVDDWISLYGFTGYYLLVQERVVFYILKTIFDIDIFVAFYKDILGVIIMSLGSIFWTLYFYRMYKNNLGLSKIVFLILFISHPILTYFTIFSIHIIGIIYMLSGLALLLYKNFITNKNIYSFLLIVILVYIGGFIYEIGFLFFVSGVVYGLLLYSMNDDNIQSFKIYRFYILSFIAICFLSIILKTIFANALILLNEAFKSHYIQKTGMVQWTFKDIKSNFEIIKNLIIPFKILYKYKLLPYSIVILILTICLSIIKKNYYILILGIISIYTSISMVLITGNVNLHLRPMIPSMIFIAFSLFLINLLCKDKSILKVLVFILSIYIFLIQARDTNYNYQNHYTRYELDKFITLNIIKQIQKVAESYDKPIYFSGRLNGYEHLKTDKKDYKDVNFSNGYELIGRSIYIDVPAFYSDVPGFFKFLGLQINLLEFINNKILLKQAEYNALSMPSYPKDGFVRDFDDYIIVKLSEKHHNMTYQGVVSD
ncbi:glucosyltransferase domain-containing protein [uncultured Brachyspira sp.]|uniref:glucosyltransferase domain-containing protein n=1 Tax=uncultured Brachyspira sp. TaxID=221953 RepID=UPI0025825B9F|nr:glucosyltransferase domain-containing protein [uncultured Brachyspira sp.]